MKYLFSKKNYKYFGRVTKQGSIRFIRHYVEAPGMLNEYWQFNTWM
jgi:hypothetical protein